MTIIMFCLQLCCFSHYVNAFHNGFQGDWSLAWRVEKVDGNEWQFVRRTETFPSQGRGDSENYELNFKDLTNDHFKEGKSQHFAIRKADGKFYRFMYIVLLNSELTLSLQN